MMFIYGSSPDQELFYSRVNPIEKQEDNQLEEAMGTSMAYTRTAQYVFLDSHTGWPFPPQWPSAETGSPALCNLRKLCNLLGPLLSAKGGRESLAAVVSVTGSSGWQEHTIP